MPWKESDAMSERLKFVARLMDGEKMTDLCEEFGTTEKGKLADGFVNVVCIYTQKLATST